MIEAVFFDLDGTLIDSEPFWIDSQIQSFTEAGVTLTPELLKQTRGLRVNQVVEHWSKQFKITDADATFLETDIYRRMSDIIHRERAIIPGAEEAIKLVHSMNKKCAVVSQSSLAYIKRAMKELNVDTKGMLLQSAEHEDYGKPHPAVYLRAAKKLNVDPSHCLVVEDSVNGVIAAKSAQMYCVAIPNNDMRGDPRFKIADKTLNNLEDFARNIIGK
jgi:sugar-phosphatase